MIEMYVSGADRIAVTFDNKSTMIYKWDGYVLKGPGKKEIIPSTEEKRQKIADAVAAYVPPTSIEKRGEDMTDEDRLHKWEFKGVENDAHGVYYRIIKGSGAIVIEFE